jgi:hypothetical protein
MVSEFGREGHSLFMSPFTPGCSPVVGQPGGGTGVWGVEVRGAEAAFGVWFPIGL